MAFGKRRIVSAQGAIDFIGGNVNKTKLGILVSPEFQRCIKQNPGANDVGLDERKDLPDEKKPPRHVGLDTDEQGRLKVREQDVWIWTRRLERYEPLAQAVYNGPDPKFLNARKLRMPKSPDMNWKPENHILMGGALTAQGDKVGPGVLSALGLPVNDEKGADADPYRIAARMIRTVREMG